jgi:hypothetical protein
VSRSGSWAGAAALLLLLVSAGCEALDLHDANKPPPPAAVCQFVATWQNHIVFAPDAMHGGTPMPGLVGRLYLFGPVLGHPVVGDGSLIVDLYDETPPDPPAGTGQPPRKPGSKPAGPPARKTADKPVLVERWNIDATTLRGLLKRDGFGWGYTLFLPSQRHRPEMTHVRLRIAYLAPAPKGNPGGPPPPVYHESPITLDSENGLIQTRSSMSTQPLPMTP